MLIHFSLSVQCRFMHLGGQIMASLDKKSNEISIAVNILIKEEDGMFVAHCLELDIVAVAKTLDQVQEEIISLIRAQIDYAFSNNNLDNLYHPAPKEVWAELKKCKELQEKKYKLESKYKKGVESLLPPWLIAKTCRQEKFCYA